jgi:hypothetical protein
METKLRYLIIGTLILTLALFADKFKMQKDINALWQKYHALEYQVIPLLKQKLY